MNKGRLFLVLSVTFILCFVLRMKEAGSATNEVMEEDSESSLCLVDPTALADVKKKERDIAQKEKELANKDMELKAAKLTFEEEFKKMRALKDEIESIQSLSQKGNEAKIAKIVETLETMNPKAASKILQFVDESLAVAAINRISTQKLAKILNIMEPEQSSKLTELMAGIVKSRAKKGVEEKNDRQS